jgi:CheY-like chemotaxis protein
MPIMDGITLLRTLKSQGSTVKFGFVTTERSKARVTEAIEAGAMFVVSKPFSPAQISEAVVEAIAVKAEPEEAGHQEHDYIDLPDIDAITHVLEDVLPGTPFVTDCPKTSTVIYPYMLGLYQNQNSQIKAAVIIDNILSCLLGAAFADVPVDTAYDSIGEKLITMELHDNVIELFGFFKRAFL